MSDTAGVPVDAQERMKLLSYEVAIERVAANLWMAVMVVAGHVAPTWAAGVLGIGCVVGAASYWRLARLLERYERERE